MNKQLPIKEQRSRRQPRRLEHAKCHVCGRKTIVREGAFTNHVRKSVSMLSGKIVVHTSQCRGSHQLVERMLKPAAAPAVNLLTPEQLLARLTGGHMTAAAATAGAD